MKYKTIELQAIQISGLPIALTSSQSENFKIIRKHWGYFNQKLREHKHNGSSSWVKYAITYKESGCYFYMPAVPKSETLPFKQLNIQPGSYAVFEHVGSMDLIKNSVHHIYKIAIPNNNITIDPDRLLIHFEKYDKRFNWNNLNSIIEIYIPMLAY